MNLEHPFIAYQGGKRVGSGRSIGEAITQARKHFPPTELAVWHAGELVGAYKLGGGEVEIFDPADKGPATDASIEPPPF